MPTILSVIPHDAVVAAAGAAHEANRSYCQSIGDFSQPKWKDAPQWQRDSAISGVRAIIANPATTPEESHDGWSKQKIDDGWKYGPMKDAEKKEHPCLVPYDALPENQRTRDSIFGSVVRATLGIDWPQ
jgi:hypothetical protein